MNNLTKHEVMEYSSSFNLLRISKLLWVIFISGSVQCFDWVFKLWACKTSPESRSINRSTRERVDSKA